MNRVASQGCTELQRDCSYTLEALTL